MLLFIPVFLNLITSLRWISFMLLGPCLQSFEVLLLISLPYFTFCCSCLIFDSNLLKDWAFSFNLLLCRFMNREGEIFYSFGMSSTFSVLDLFNFVYFEPAEFSYFLWSHSRWDNCFLALLIIFMFYYNLLTNSLI